MASDEEKSKRSRTRSGCFTCRDRHMKCDEQLPVCQNCINSKRKCFRGIRLNFTQYTLYDPKDPSNGIIRPASYRIVDQSIPVASLYKNGLKLYEACRHLHSLQDLQDAQDSLSQDLKLNINQAAMYMEPVNKPIEDANFNNIESANFMANTSMAVPMDPWSFSQPLADNYSFNFTEDTVLENFDIRNLLMNPAAADTQLLELKSASLFVPETNFSSPDSAPRRTRNRVSSENIISNEDSEKLVNLLNSEKYFWLLDLFNELGIWKSSIPNYAARLAQTKENKDTKSRAKTLLLECLLCCCKDATLATVEAACRSQLECWQKFESRDVATSTFKEFERVLISNVLIVNALLLQAMEPDFTTSEHFEVLLATQGRLLHKLAARFQRIPESRTRKLNGFVFTIASFQALVILRFFMQTRLRMLNFAGARPMDNQQNAAFDPLATALDARILSEQTYNVAEFFTLSELESTSLKNHFHEFDLNTGKYASDSAKLRAQFWNLCLITACGGHSNHANYEEPQDIDPSRVLLSNDKCIALNIVSAYTKVLQDPTTQVSLEYIFQQIQASLMNPKEKRNWIDYFGWARTGVWSTSA